VGTVSVTTVKVPCMETFDTTAPHHRRPGHPGRAHPVHRRRADDDHSRGTAVGRLEGA
jgi:hypothetical protein